MMQRPQSCDSKDCILPTTRVSCQDNFPRSSRQAPYLAKNWMLSVGHPEQENLAEHRHSPLTLDLKNPKLTNQCCLC